VIVSGAVISGGTALPAEIAVATAFFAGGTITLASAAGVQVTNTLTSLGFDKAQASKASKRMLALTDLIKEWDTRFNNLLQAGGSLHSPSQSISAVANSISGIDADARRQVEEMKSACTAASSFCGAFQRGVAAKDAIKISSVMKAMLDVGLDSAVTKVAGETALCKEAPKAMFGLVKAGSAGARGLFFALSGVGIVFSLVDVIAGLGSLFSGACQAADCLDAHADKLCTLLQIMLIAGRGTPEADKIIHRQELPRLLLVSVRSCTVRRPSYRFGDLSKRVARKLSGSGPPTHDVYFSVALGNRNRCTEVVALSEEAEAVNMAEPLVIITRVLDGDDTLSLKMCARRGLGHRLTVGDSCVTRSIEVSLPEPSDDPIVHESDCEGLLFAYQLLDSPQCQETSR